MEIDYGLIGERIKDARRSKGLSQESLSEAIDVAVTYISRVERGYGVNLKRLSQISQVLDVPLEALIAGASEKSRDYLRHEMASILDRCSPNQQRLLYSIAKIILGEEVGRMLK